MRIACVQLAARNAEEESLALQEALEGVEKAASGGADLVLLPEAVWPGYVLGPWLQDRKPEEVEEDCRRVWEIFSRISREKRIGLGVGMLTVRSGKYYNSLVLFGPRGEELGRGDKSFLWHFDSSWFTPGESLGILETPWGKIGLLVCADARIPEITRTLVRRGAWLVLDAANLTSTGYDLEKASNQQVDFMLAARARENGIYFAMANKIGLERDSVLYCGKSSLWNPRGELVVRADHPKQDVIWGDVDFAEVRNARKSPDLSEKYWSFLEKAEFFPPLSRKEEVHSLLLTGMIQKDWNRAGSLAWLEKVLWDLSVQGASPVLLPPFSEENSFEKFEETLRELSRKYPNLTLAASLKEGGRPRSLVLSRGEELESLSRVSGVRLFSRSWGRFGVLWNREGEIPEIPRIMALEGADLLLWGGGACEGDLLFSLARTRAAENRVFVALGGSESGGVLFGPGGEILARGLGKRDQAVLGSAFLPLARLKEFVPGTDVLGGRNAEQYGL